MDNNFRLGFEKVAAGEIADEVLDSTRSGAGIGATGGILLGLMAGKKSLPETLARAARFGFQGGMYGGGTGLILSGLSDSQKKHKEKMKKYR